MITETIIPVKADTNKLIEESFNAVTSKVPAEWVAPSIKYKRWSSSRRYSYYGYGYSRYKNIPVEEHQIRNVVHYLNPRGLDKVTEASLEEAGKIPAVKKLLTTMQLNFVNEFLKVSNQLIEDREKKAAAEHAKAEKKRLAKIKTEKNQAAARKKRAEEAAIRKAKLDEIKEKNKQKALRKALREQKIANKNKELLDSLCLTASQKAILKKLAV
jgi:hypothetical protein